MLIHFLNTLGVTSNEVTSGTRDVQSVDTAIDIRRLPLQHASSFKRIDQIG